MRVMVMVKATPSSEAGEMPSEQLMADMGKFNEELVKAGIMQAGEGLKPSSEGVRVHFSGSQRTVTDGPFAETKELVAGFWLWNVNSMQEAIDWVKRCPNPKPTTPTKRSTSLNEFQRGPNDDDIRLHFSTCIMQVADRNL